MLLGSLFGLLAAAAGMLFLFPPAWFPIAITHQGQQYDSQFFLTLWLSGLIFVAVHLLLIGLSFRKLRKPLKPKWETLWTFLATVFFAFLAFTGTRIWAGVHPNPIPPDAVKIEVLGYQFAWSFRYPGPDGKFGRTAIQYVNDPAGNPFGIDPADPAGRDDVVSATLKVPAGRDIILTLHARDVIHDFFVRELRLKQDAVPGMDIPYRFRAEVPGIYEIACAELCGLGHSQMRSTLEVVKHAAPSRAGTLENLPSEHSKYAEQSSAGTLENFPSEHSEYAEQSSAGSLRCRSFHRNPKARAVFTATGERSAHRNSLAAALSTRNSKARAVFITTGERSACEDTPGSLP